MDLDYIDLVFCHRPDPNTPVEETVWAMSDMITRGKALYWGTSEWSAQEIRAAWDIADRHHLHKPVMEQPQYHLFHRQRVEQEYARLYEDIGLGLTTWSPLASGLLTGKYRNGVPPGSRGALESMGFLVKGLTHAEKNAAVAKLEAVAAELGCPLPQMAIAWAARNPRVSTVITGASRLAQLQENLGAVDVIPKMTPRGDGAHRRDRLAAGKLTRRSPAPRAGPPGTGAAGLRRSCAGPGRFRPAAPARERSAPCRCRHR